MNTIVLLSQKGGAGKTTLALHLAVASEQAGIQTAIIDIDPQQSAAAWGESRELETPVTVATQAERLPHILQVAKQQGCGLVVIDTAPHSEQSALVAAKLADFILIPCRPAILDLRAIGSSIELAKSVNKPCAVVLNGTPPRFNKLRKEAEEAISSYGVQIAPIALTNRITFGHALTAGLTATEFDPSSKASDEVKQLYMYVVNQLNK